MYVDVWSVIANQEQQLSSVEKLSKMKLIKRSPHVTFFLTYFKVSNAVLKTLLKTKIRLQALLKII
jgi:hypothetical protein